MTDSTILRAQCSANTFQTGGALVKVRLVVYNKVLKYIHSPETLPLQNEKALSAPTNQFQ